VITASTAIYDNTALQSKSSVHEQSNSMHDVEDSNWCFWQQMEFKMQENRNRFSEKYYASSEGNLQNKRNQLYIYDFFFWMTTYVNILLNNTLFQTKNTRKT
jgi:hypothetical protein